jgi:hypothetical protein
VREQLHLDGIGNVFAIFIYAIQALPIHPFLAQLVGQRGGDVSPIAGCFPSRQNVFLLVPPPPPPPSKLFASSALPVPLPSTSLLMVFSTYFPFLAQSAVWSSASLVLRLLFVVYYLFPPPCLFTIESGKDTFFAIPIFFNFRLGLWLKTRLKL